MIIIFVLLFLVFTFIITPSFYKKMHHSSRLDNIIDAILFAGALSSGLAAMTCLLCKAGLILVVFLSNL